MFVLRSIHKATLQRLREVESTMQAATVTMRELRILNRDLRTHLTYWRLAAQKGKAQFSPAELQRLRYLCHPDKHNGSASAVELTKKLNAVIAEQKDKS